jgi:hypothetical protein
MNSINKTLIERKFQPVRIDWEDFIAIENILKENFENYTIEADDIEYSSSDELREDYDDIPIIRKIRIKNLVFRSSNPEFFAVEMSRNQTVFHSKIENDKIIKIEELIENILQKRVLHDSFFNKPLFQKISPFILGIFFISIIIFRNDDNLILLFSFACFLVAILMYCGGNQYYKPILTIIVESEEE